MGSLREDQKCPYTLEQSSVDTVLELCVRNFMCGLKKIKTKITKLIKLKQQICILQWLFLCSKYIAVIGFKGRKIACQFGSHA